MSLAHRVAACLAVSASFLALALVVVLVFIVHSPGTKAGAPHCLEITTMTTTVKSYAAHSPTEKLSLFTLDRRSARPDDVVIEILFCGVCHSDLHNIRNDWGNARYPMVPGHEVVGRVVDVGPAVTRFKTGDRVAVGCLVDSCRRCAACGKGWEQYCENGPTLRPGAESHRRSDLHFDHLFEAAKDHALAVEGHGGIAGCGRVHARVFHHLLHGGVARGLVGPFDPRKGHRFLGRGLDRATEIGDFAVGDIVAPSLDHTDRAQLDE
jgi:hypothetical protein